jgi:hypothetical protein
MLLLPLRIMHTKVLSSLILFVILYISLQNVDVYRGGKPTEGLEVRLWKKWEKREKYPKIPLELQIFSILCCVKKL